MNKHQLLFQKKNKHQLVHQKMSRAKATVKALELKREFKKTKDYIGRLKRKNKILRRTILALQEALTINHNKDR